MAGLAVGVEIASVLRHLGGRFISHVVGKRRFDLSNLFIHVGNARKGAGFGEKVMSTV